MYIKLSFFSIRLLLTEAIITLTYIGQKSFKKKTTVCDPNKMKISSLPRKKTIFEILITI